MAGVTDVKMRSTIRDGSLPLNLVSSDSILGYRWAYLHCLLERGFVSMVQNRLHCGPALLTARRGGLWFGLYRCLSRCPFCIGQFNGAIYSAKVGNLRAGLSHCTEAIGHCKIARRDDSVDVSFPVAHSLALHVGGSIGLLFV